jgi:hypothetical protein
LVAAYTGLVRSLGLLRRALVPTEVALLEMITGSYGAQALADVLHDWGDDECGVILGHIANAIKPSGRLLVVELLRGSRAFPVPAAMDLGMMVLTRGGRERSRAEFERLLHSAGFGLRSVVSASVFMSILVAEPVSLHLQQSGPSVVPEQIGVADIGLEHVRLVPGRVPHLEHRSTAADCTDQEAGAERMGAEVRGPQLSSS